MRNDEKGQSLVEYAAMLAILLLIVVGTVRLIAGHADAIFSQTSSALTP